MSHTPNYDAKINIILADLKPGERICVLTGEKWLMTDEEIGWYKKFNAPPVSFCPDICRKLVASFSAGLYLWWNKHAFTGQPILSYVHPDNPIKVIPDAEWHTYDWAEKANLLPEVSVSFFDQLRRLFFQVPLPALRVYGTPKNTVGVSVISAEDCFMVLAPVNSKRCAYSSLVVECEDVFDSFLVTNCSGCLAVCRSEKLFNCSFSLHCAECLNCSFVFDCRNCENCFGSSNLRNRKFVFWNEQLSKEEYELRLSQIDLSDTAQFEASRQRFFEVLKKEAIWPSDFNVGSEDSSGEYLTRCLRSRECYSMLEATDCFRNIWGPTGSQECSYCSGTSGANQAYLSSGVVASSDIKFCYMVARSRNLEYCVQCFDCESCFGCVGLKNKSFHIFNTPYSEEGYWKIINELKLAMLERGEYGQFLPSDFSAPGFVFATDFYFNWSEEDLRRLGALSFNPLHGNFVSEQQSVAIDEHLSAVDLPDRLIDVDENRHIGKPIFDPSFGRFFSIRPDDLAFYRQFRLPLPKEHPLARSNRVARMSNSLISEKNNCLLCQKNITVYKNLSFDERRIYCHECYLKYLEENN